MKTSTLILGGLLCMPLSARAEPTPAQQHERHQKEEQHRRLERVVGMAEALNLDEQGALRLDAQMKPFDDRREPLHEQMRNDSKILQQAAEGDPAAGAQVDAALGRMFETRAKLEQVNHEMLEALSKGMAPQQKAKLAVFLATFGHHPGGHGGGEGKFGHGGPRGE